MPVDPWGGWNQGFNQLINVLAMKRQEKRDEGTNALAMERLKMEREKFGMEKEQATRGKQADMMKDAVVLTQDMAGDGSPEDMAKFQARRAMFVQKWGEVPNIPKDYDPQYIKGLKNYGRDPDKAYHSIGAGGLLNAVTKKITPPVAKPMKELSEKDKIIQKLRAEGKLSPEEEKIIAGAVKPPSTQVTVDVGPKAMTKLGEEMSKSLVVEHQEAQKSAQSLQELQTAKQLLKDPMITGAGANTILAIGKGLQQMGVSFAAEPIANTEAFTAQMGKQVGQVIKNFGSGTGLSDADREYAEKIAGGKITLTKQSIEKIIALNEKATRNIIANYNKKASQAMKRPGGESLPYSLLIEMPEERARKAASPANIMPESEAREKLKRQGIIGKRADEKIQKYKAAGVVE